jgi:hypothetical protein
MSKKILKTLAITIGLVVLCSTCLYAGSQLQPIEADLNYGLTVAMNDKVVPLKDASGNTVTPITYNNTTYLPVRAISNALGVSVDWNQEYQCVLLNGSSVPAELKGGNMSIGEQNQGTRHYTEQDVTMMAKLMFAEARGIASKEEVACIGWVVLNRVEHKDFPNTIQKVITQPSQFAYYANAGTVSDCGFDLKELARSVLDYWSNEKNTGYTEGRVLPKRFLYFGGNGKRNTFRTEYSLSSEKWDFSANSPY